MGISGPIRQLDVRSFRAPPQSLTPEILDLCRQVAPSQLPVRVGALPARGARPHMCFENVRDVCDQNGGRAVNGWLIWEWKGNFLEAEHHAVWWQDGHLFDVTPHGASYDSVLFVAEPQRDFDFGLRHRLDNVRVALRNDASVREYIELSARFIAIEEAHSCGSEVVLPAIAHRELEVIRSRLRAIEKELVAWSVNRMGRNDPCFCASGRKFKNCCISDAGQFRIPEIAAI